FGIEGSEDPSDFFGCPPGRVLSCRESEVPCNAMHVGVDWDEEDRRRKGPDAEVDAICGSDHPTEIEKETLATAAWSGIAHEMQERAAVRSSTQLVRETSERFSQIAARRFHVGLKRKSETPELPLNSRSSEEHVGDVPTCVGPMDEPLKQANERALRP